MSPRRGATNRRRACVAWWTTACLLAALFVAVVAQDAGVLLQVEFEQAQALARSFDARLQNVSCLDTERAATVTRRGFVSFSAKDHVTAGQGAVSFAWQPRESLNDGANHRLFTWGRHDQPQSLIVWKTAQFNDLRVRFRGAGEPYIDLHDAGAALWSPGAWHHIAVSWNAGRGEWALYVDGRLRDSARSRLPQFAPAGEELRLGASDDMTGVEGAFDQLRICRQSLTQPLAQREFERFLRAERTTLSPGDTPRQVAAALLPPADFTFVVLSDTHLSEAGRRGQYAHNWRFTRLVIDINQWRPDFVVNCGDIVTTFPGRPELIPQMDEAARLFKQLRVPAYQTPGNHDVGNKHQLRFSQPNAPAEVRRGYFVNEDNLRIYRQHFGDDFFSWNHRGRHFIVLNNQVLNSGLPTEKSQWEWLQRDLESVAGSQGVFVFMHNPLFWVSTDEPGTNNYELVNDPMRSRLMALLRRHGATAVFTGHTHHRISNLVAGVRYLTLPSTTFARPFGRNYGRSNLQTIYDPVKVGCYLVRLRGRDMRLSMMRTYPPLLPRRALQRGNENDEVRLAPPESDECGPAPLVFTSAEPPPMESGIWAAAHLNDGVIGSEETGMDAAAYGWTSEAHPAADAEEWAQITLPSPQRPRVAEFWARPGGSGFPIDFEVLVSADGKQWRRVASFTDYQMTDPPVLRQSLDATGPIRAVRLLSHKMPPMFQGHRASVMEIRLLDAHGNNLAAVDTGAVASAASQASGKRQTVDDQAWQAPADAGITWVRLPAATLRWVTAATEDEPSLPPRLQRALTLGRRPGLKYLAPVVMRLPDGAPETSPRTYVARFERYCKRLQRAVGFAADGWELMWDLPQPPSNQLLREALITLRRCVGRRDTIALRVPTGLRDFTDLPADMVIDTAVLTATPERSLASHLSDRGNERSPSRWVELVAGDGPPLSPPAYASILTRATLMAASARNGLCWTLPAGRPGGLVDQDYNPTPVHYAAGVLSAALAGATPVDLGAIAAVRASRSGVIARAFRRRDGTLLVSLWSDAPADRTSEPILCSLIPRQAAAEVWLIDPLRATAQRAGETVDDLLVTERPLLVWWKTSSPG